MDLFEDIPADLESIPIDDLFFSDYLENLLDPSVSSAGAFSSDNQQIEGACEPLPLHPRPTIHSWQQPLKSHC